MWSKIYQFMFKSWSSGRFRLSQLVWYGHRSYCDIWVWDEKKLQIRKPVFEFEALFKYNNNSSSSSCGAVNSLSPRFIASVSPILSLSVFTTTMPQPFPVSICHCVCVCVRACVSIGLSKWGREYNFLQPGVAIGYRDNAMALIRLGGNNNINNKFSFFGIFKNVFLLFALTTFVREIGNYHHHHPTLCVCVCVLWKRERERGKKFINSGMRSMFWHRQGVTLYLHHPLLIFAFDVFLHF